MNACIGFLLTFLGGIAFALNLSVLIPRNPSYEASWTKVIIALVIAILGALFSHADKGK